MANRMEQMKKDIDEVLEKLATFDLDIIDGSFDYNDNCLSFQIKDEETDGWRPVSVCFSEDYPDGTVICERENSESDFVTMRATAMDAVDVISKKRSSWTQISSRVNSSDSWEMLKLGSSNEDFEAEIESGSTDEFALDDDDDDYLEYYTQVEPDPYLISDVDYCDKALGGGDSCSMVTFISLDTAHVTMKLPIDEPEIEDWTDVAQSSEDEKGKHVYMELRNISVDRYRFGAKPIVKIFQGSKSMKTNSFLEHLQCVAQKYVDNNWEIPTMADYTNRCFLLEASLYTWDRMADLLYYCTICDQPHELSPMLLPSICTRKSCLIKFHNLGLSSEFSVKRLFGYGDTEEYKDSPQIEVIDLLMRAFENAVKSEANRSFGSGNRFILNPCDKDSTVIDRTKQLPDWLGQLDNNWSQGLTEHLSGRLAVVVANLPSAAQLNELADYGEYIFPFLENIGGKYLHAVIHWLITSNPTYLVRLHSSDRLPFLPTCHQYFMMLDSPEREIAFRQAKEQHGESIFAFKELHFAEFHDILRDGLGVCQERPSNETEISLMPLFKSDKFYLAGTTDHGPVKEEFLKPRILHTCVALCEVVPVNLKKYTTYCGEEIWSIEDSKMICPRFIFLFDGVPESISVDCLDPKTLSAIRYSVDKLRKSAGAM